MMGPEVCKHGQLARCCSVCELEVDNDSLRQQLAAVAQWSATEAAANIPSVKEYCKSLEKQLAACQKERDDLIEIVTHDKQLAECQVALKAKDKAMAAAWAEGYSFVGAEGFSDTQKTFSKALTIKPSDEALREWGAKLLELVAKDQAILNFIDVLAKQLRSGEWKP